MPETAQHFSPDACSADQFAPAHYRSRDDRRRRPDRHPGIWRRWLRFSATCVYRGVGSINWAFLTQTPKPVGETGGGMANAIVGSVFILGIASVIGVPFGIGAGIYLAEFGRNRLGAPFASPPTC